MSNNQRREEGPWDHGVRGNTRQQQHIVAPKTDLVDSANMSKKDMAGVALSFFTNYSNELQDVKTQVDATKKIVDAMKLRVDDLKEKSDSAIQYFKSQC